ncbi:MAG: hypothetical protein LBF51_06785, partial [Zoogloeaceae bacterium]|nr:hypothetical protein [Zoogloeaceae bacterium]
MNTRDFCSGAPRRVTALFLAGFAAAVLADDPSVTLPNKFEAPDISNMPLSMGSEVPPNVMLLINTGSITHYGYLPTNGDRYDLRSSAFGTTNPSRLNKPFHSSHINKIYYDPAVEYKRPLGFQPGTTTEWPDASFASAPIDGFGVFNSGMSTKNRNLANNFCATHYADSNSVIDDCVDAPAYKTDGTGGPSTGTTIGRTAHYNLYHPGRVARNADGSVKVNPSVKDAGGNETWQDIRAIPAYVSGSMNVPIQYIVNKGGEAHLTYGTAENPARQGCEFQDTSMSATSRTDYSKFGKFGSGQSDYVFPAGYDYTSSSSTTGSTDVSDSSVVSNPQYQFTTGNDRNHNWLIKYYNCFEAIRVGEAEDKDEYYTWWDAAKNGPIEAADKRQNFANWFSYYYHPGSLMKTVLSHALNDLDPETRIGYAVTGCNSGCGSSSGWGGTYGSGHMLDGFDSKNNYVKRGVRPFKDFDPGDPSGYGVGGQGAAACSPAGKCKTQVLDWLFKLSGSSSDYAGYASMRQSLAGVGTYYTNNTKKGPWSSTPGFERAANAATGADATRFQSCRKSYVLTLTGGNFDTDDGKPLDDMRDADNKSGPSILHANESDTYGTTPYVYVPTLPFKDHNTNTLPTSLTTMADVAMHYWKNDLLMRTVDGRSDNNVPRGTQDPAFWQHMNVVAIHLDDSAYSVDWQRITKAMNMNPTDAKAMFDANDWGYPGPAYAASCGSSWTNGPGCPVPPMSGWGNPDRNDRENQPENLLNGDDLMHAAINSRGFYASTLNPSEISGLIQQGLSFVRTDNAISMSSAATNTTSSQVPMIY